MPAKFIRSEPAEGNTVFDVDTVVLYFDNRPTDVKIKEASKYIEQAIVKNNTVEISIDHPISKRYIEFIVTWADGERWLLFPTKSNAPPDVWSVWPADGSSIVGFKTIRLYLTDFPKNAKYYDHASESFGEATTISNTIEFDVPHLIEGPSISFTVSWSGQDESMRKEITLTYTNEDVKPEE